MQNPAHDFDQQLMRGESGEAFLDQFFASRGHYIQQATRGQQLIGVDRVFLRGGKMAYVEYKTDFRTHETGHVFIETVSVDADDKAGWAYTSQADYLVYYIPGVRIIYVIPLARLRSLLEEWSQRYPVRVAQNADYNTHGILVPVQEFARHTTQHFEL